MPQKVSVLFHEWTYRPVRCAMCLRLDYVQTCETRVKSIYNAVAELIYDWRMGLMHRIPGRCYQHVGGVLVTDLRQPHSLAGSPWDKTHEMHEMIEWLTDRIDSRDLTTNRISHTQRIIA
ncbi:hypothetical protein FPOAC2_05023 [Fusarium poae]